jgi:hypothetical protein
VTHDEAKGFAPRTNADDVEEGGSCAGWPPGSRSNDTVPRAEQLGANKPRAGTAERRAYRKPRAVLVQGTAKEQAVAGALTNDVRETLSRYGNSVARASAGRNLNTKLIQSGQKLPANLSKGEFAALKAAGKSVYRVRRGVLEKVDDHAIAAQASARHAGKGAAPLKGAAARGQAKAAGGGGQYAILDDAVVRHVRQRTPVTENTAAKIIDKTQGSWKSLALATPGYLVRNVLGDSFNAAVHENPFTLARSVLKSQKALQALGRYEKASRIFEKQLPKGKGTIKLTPEQAAALGTTKSEIPAMQAALLAEKLGVIRQGRFLELIEEGGRRPKGTAAWHNAVKRVEDSVRMTTFMGSLQRGLNPREAAANATKIHFDYGDLNAAEKGFLRRVMPFYTFTSRNIPLQAQGILKHPGKYAAVQKARDEGRRSSGLPEGYEGGLNPYEARQLGIPMRIGGKIFTVSAALPFTDLNDVASFSQGPTAVGASVVHKTGEMLSPFLKLAPELTYNQSLFFRDQIEKGSAPYTRAPGWAIAMAKADPGFAKKVGMVPDYVTPEGDKTYGWSRKADYAFRQGMPGPIAPALDLLGLGVKGKNARDMSKAQRLLAFGGARAITYDPATAEINGLYAEQDRLTKAQTKLRHRAHPHDRQSNGGPLLINADHPTPEYLRNAAKLSNIGKRLDALKAGARPRGFVAGKAVADTRKRSSGRIATGGRVNTGGRINTGATRIAIR